MPSEHYLSRITEIIGQIQETQKMAMEKAAVAIARSIQSGGIAFAFGSGHSVIPVLELFPRYGAFAGFWPIYDPRLMWFNVVGPGGPRELVWLERQEGYMQNVLSSYVLKPGDSMLIFSHGGLHAAPIEVAMEAKAKGLTVISIGSHQNYRRAAAAHSSGKKLLDLSDIAIDNCVPPEDALVSVEGIEEKFGCGSSVAATVIALELLAQTASILTRNGHKPRVLVSPHLGLPPDNNARVFQEFVRRISSRIS